MQLHFIGSNFGTACSCPHITLPPWNKLLVRVECVFSLCTPVKSMERQTVRLSWTFAQNRPIRYWLMVNVPQSASSHSRLSYWSSLDSIVFTTFKQFWMKFDDYFVVYLLWKITMTVREKGWIWYIEIFPK